MQEAKVQWAQDWLKQDKKSYWNGRWHQGQGREWVSINPAQQSELGRWNLLSPHQIQDAIHCTEQNYVEGPWRKRKRGERAQALRTVAELIRSHRAELATLEALNNGKLYREAYEDDIPEAADVFDYYAGWVDKHYGDSCPVEAGFVNYTVNEPLGVCAAIVPWNFPILMACWKMAPALALGNAVIVKPSEYTPLSLIRLFEVIDQAKVLDPEAAALVLGDHQVGEALCSSHQVHKVSFTGSTAVGKMIAQQAAASNLKSCTLELGGKSANIIFDDVPDFDLAIQRSFTAMFSHKGEKCSEPTRLFVHHSLYEESLKRLKIMADAISYGDPFDASSTQGPQCHRAHYLKILEYIQSAKDEGARLICGGGPAQNPQAQQGLYIKATVFADVKPGMRIFQEEIFGPVLTVTPFSSDQEVVTMANDTIYGLAAGFYSKDVNRCHRIARQLDAGMIFINRYGCYDFSSPFGGFRQSGWGKEMAKHSLQSYSKVKSIWFALEGS